MELIKVNKEISPYILDKISTSLKNSGLVIFPTETVYGIGANALDELAVSKIFEAKNRKGDNPLIVHLKNPEDIEKYAYIENEIERRLIKTFMPGPFTIILRKKDIIPMNTSGGLDTVGIRVPKEKTIHAILEHLEFPLAAPSANISGRPSGTNINDIYEEFKDKVDYIIDGGSTDIGLESTVVRVINNEPVILRPGYITKEDIEKVINNVKVDDNIFNKDVNKPLSPGMKYKHYAPKALCKVIYISNKEELINNIKNISTKDSVIIGSSILKNIPCKKFLLYGDNLKEISHNIFTLLRKADTYNPDMIIIEGVKKEGLGLAIMNRLIRSCNHNYIYKESCANE